MATNKGKPKTRLDFSNTLFQNIQQPDNVEVANEPVVPTIPSAIPQPVVETQAPAQPKVEPAFSDELLRNAEQLRRQRGMQKNIYMDMDSVEYINALAAKTGVTFSKIANMLLKKAIQMESNSPD